MKITKYGHSCILVEETSVRILFDPGNYSTIPTNLSNVDLILITHEHQDHVDINTIKRIIKNNPQIKILTNSSVHEILKKEHIASEIAKDGEIIKIKEIKIQPIGKMHAIIYQSSPCENIGFLIEDKLYHPGDSFTVPNQKVEILALPTEAPWMKTSEAVDFALKIKPRICFPIHDGRLRLDRIGSSHRVPQTELEKIGTNFMLLEENNEYEF